MWEALQLHVTTTFFVYNGPERSLWEREHQQQDGVAVDQVLVEVYRILVLDKC